MGDKSGFDPNSLKLYQLFIGLGSHEFRFQSMESPKQKFIVNVDTVEVQYLAEQGSDPRYQHRIRILVDKKYDIDFYFTTATLPFGMQDSLHAQDAHKILANIYETTTHKVKLAIEESKGLKYQIKGSTLPSEDYYEVSSNLCSVAMPRSSSSSNTLKPGTCCFLRTTTPSPRSRGSSPTQRSIMWEWSSGTNGTVSVSSSPTEELECPSPCGTNLSATSGSRTSRGSSGGD